MADNAPARRGLWRRFRAPIVLLPLLVGLVFAGYQGAKQLWADGADRSGPPPEVTCWDGETRPSAECGQPEDVRGLGWVFPSFQPQQDGCTQIELAPRKLARPLEYSCPVEFQGSPVSITYARRTSTAAARQFLTKHYAGVTVRQVADGVVIYRDPEPRRNGKYKATLNYTDVPFSVTVSAPGPDLRDAALAELVTYRDAVDVALGYATDQWAN